MTALPPPLGGLASDPSSLAGAIQSKVGNASAALASAMFSADAGVAAAASVVADSKTNAGLATVDKFAALPWVGKTGLLLGRNVTHANALGYFGPGSRPP